MNGRAAFHHGLLSAAIFVVLLLCGKSIAESELPSEQHWNLAEICRMESADYWTGPWPQSDVNVSPDCIEGKYCIETKLKILPGHFVRLEKNFVADCHDGFRNMMAFGMVDEDFSAYSTLTFQYKTDILNITELTFRLYDREGGWIQWDIQSPSDALKWRKVALTMPSHAWPDFNHHRVGGFIWEISAGESEIDGKFWLDDLQLLSAQVPGLNGTARRPAKIDYRMNINPPSSRNRYVAGDIHLIMNMTGEIGISIYECDTTEAIKRFSEAVAIFRDVPDLEFFFAPEAWRLKRDSPNLKDWFAKSRATQVAMAQWCERNEVPFYIGIGVAGDGSFATPPETVRAVLEAAPRFCRGAVMGEFSIESNDGIDQTVAIMRVLKSHGLKLLYYQQSSYWFGIMLPHGDVFRGKILDPEFRDVFVPMWENLLPSAQGLCLASILGLWRSGLVSDWGVSAQGWGYANMNWGGTSDQPGNIWLRMFLSVAGFGGRYIEIEPKWAFDGENVPGQIIHFKQWAHNLRWVGRRRAQIDIDLDPGDPMRALRLFNRLLQAKVVLPAADPDKVLSISPVAFQVEPTENWGKWCLFHRAVDKQFYDNCCPNYTQMSTQVPPEDAFAYLYLSNHFYDQTFPVNTYGLVSVLAQEARVGNGRIVFKTDGDQVRYLGQRLVAIDARSLIETEFQTGIATMPFAAENCTWSAIEVGNGDYLITLLDPEERFPVGVQTNVRVNLHGAWKAFDGMTSQELPAKERCIPVDIDPGGFRLIRVIQQE